MTTRGAAISISHRNGLRPLTLPNNPPLNVKNTFGRRRTASLFNGTKRLSPLVYISDSRRGHSPPTRLTETTARRVSLPSDVLERMRTDVSERLKGEIQLTSKLQEEMKLTARLQNDLVELRDRACAELNQSKYETQALAVAVDSREYSIRDLATSVEFLRVENKVLKNANRQDLCQNITTEAFMGMTVDRNIRRFSPKIKTREPGQEDVTITISTKPSGGLKSTRKKRLGQRCVKRSSVTSGDLSGIGWDHLGEDSSRNTASWLSLGTVSEPTLEPLRGGRESFQVSRSDDTEYCEYSMDTLEGCLEVEFPTISPQFPPCHVAALARSKAAIPSRGIILYEVDGRAVVPYHKHLLSSSQLSTNPVLSRPRVHQTIASSPRHSRSGTRCLASNQNCQREASCLAIQQDSPFCAVPASTFIVPHL